MLMILYTFLAMALTPIVYDLVNRRATANERVMNVIHGWPAYALNVIVCGVVALGAMFLPGGWELSLWNWIVLTALIYFGNQFVYQTVVKRFFATRTG